MRIVDYVASKEQKNAPGKPSLYIGRVHIDLKSGAYQIKDDSKKTVFVGQAHN